MLKITSLLLSAAPGVAIWWHAFDSRAPANADDAIPLDALRKAIATDQRGQLPLEVELYRTGAGTAPMFAVETGGGLGKFAMAYTAFGIRYTTSRVMIDAAAGRETAMAIGDKATARFDDATYALLLERIAQADSVILTNEHKDHVMAAVRNPAFAGFADRLRFPETQRYCLLRYARPEATHAKIEGLAATAIDRAKRLAHGIAAAPAPGHSPGSLVILANVANGREYLFIGDIAWSFDDITKLKTRPRFLQWLMFDPGEQGDQVLRQLRALHDLHRCEQDLLIGPSHDNRWFDELVAHHLMTPALSDTPASSGQTEGRH